MTINFSWNKTDITIQTQEKTIEYYKYMFCDRYFVEWCRSHEVPGYASMTLKDKFKSGYGNKAAMACIQSLRLEYESHNFMSTSLQTLFQVMRYVSFFLSALGGYLILSNKKL